MSYELYIAGINELPAEDLDSLINNISDCRKAKIEKYKFERDKRLCLLSTLLLNKALMKYGLSEKNMEYSTNEYGKPYFVNAPNLHFSISHSGEYAMVVISDHEIGCDIQQIKEIKLGIAERFFSKSEQEYIKNTDDFFRIWTLKESFIKAIGKGLTLPLDSFTIEGLNTDKPYCKYDEKKYTFIEFCKEENYRTAICKPSNYFL